MQSNFKYCEKEKKFLYITFDKVQTGDFFLYGGLLYVKLKDNQCLRLGRDTMLNFQDTDEVILCDVELLYTMKQKEGDRE